MKHGYFLIKDHDCSNNTLLYGKTKGEYHHKDRSSGSKHGQIVPPVTNDLSEQTLDEHAHQDVTIVHC